MILKPKYNLFIKLVNHIDPFIRFYQSEKKIQNLVLIQFI